MWMKFFASQSTAKGYYHLLKPHDFKQNREREANVSCKTQDFILNITRNALLSITTSLTKVSKHVHEFFSKLSTFLAFERMMRDCFAWMAPIAPMGLSALGLAMPNWDMTAWLSPPKPQPQPEAYSWWGDLFSLPQPLPKPEPKREFFPSAMLSTGMPVFGALLAVPTVFLAMTPAAMQAWGLQG